MRQTDGMKGSDGKIGTYGVRHKIIKNGNEGVSVWRTEAD